MRYSIFTAVLGLLLIGSVGNSFAHDDSERSEVLLKIILQGLKQVHYDPQNLDDDFSEKVYEIYLDQLDPRKRYFVQADIDQLNAYKHEIDDATKAANYEFFDLSIDLLEERQKEAQTIYEEVLEQPFDFSVDETVYLDYEEMTFAASKADLKERWRKTVKYQVLARLVDELESQEKGLRENDPKVEIKSFDELEAKARERVGKTYKNMFSTFNKLDTRDRVNNYVRSITMAYDPHTGYFPPADKENFDISISGRLEGIGARLTERDGYVTVTEIVPGSASWKQGDLKAEDVILKVAQGSEEPVDVVDMKLDDAVKLIRGKKGSEVRLTVRKLDGEVMTIPIVRDVVELEESYAKSAILKDDASKVGYINLPKFYAPFGGQNGRSCAEDIKEEVTKLKDENVDGIVIDLRNNSGGSLNEVVEMAGLFIEDGPIVQVKERQGPPDVYRDRDKSIHYEGPLVIMVNTFSASASEILAGAMQDYKRAVVIGTESTYGKGTVQRFINLDQAVPPDFSDLKPLGSLKLTIQKFYRINGSTNQLKGVVPDVVLPDIYQDIEIGEKQQEYAMSWDEIKPLSYKTWKDAPSINKIRNKSTKRVAANPIFNLINENASHLKTQRDRSDFTLNLEQYRSETKELKDRNDKFKAIEKNIEGLDASLTKTDAGTSSTDEVYKERMDAFLEGLTKDVYIQEAISVMEDI